MASLAAGQVTRFRQHSHRPFRPNRKFEEVSDNAVFLSGLPKDVDRETLYIWAKTFGWVKKFDLPGGSQGYRNKGFAYLHFRNKKEAQALINRGTVTCQGKQIKVEPYTNKREDIYSGMATPVPKQLLEIQESTYDSDCPSGYASGVQTQSLNTRCGSPNSGRNSPPLSARRPGVPAPLNLDSNTDNSWENKSDLQTPTPAQITHAITNLDLEQRVQGQINVPQNSQQNILQISNDAVNLHNALYESLLNEIIRYNARNGSNLWATPELVDSYFAQCISLMKQQSVY